MKFLRSMGYVVRSVLLRGLANTVRLGVLEMKGDKAFGIRTGGMSDENGPESHHYQGAGYMVIMRIFADLVGNHKDYHFVDIGCGKGRALVVADHCGFQRITGLELFPDLAKEAGENILKYSRGQSKNHMSVVVGNALEYEYTNEPTVYFLFNPFGEEVLKRVLLKILQSTRSDTVFVYMNPVHAHVFSDLGIRKAKVYKTRFYTEAIIYHLLPQV